MDLLIIFILGLEFGSFANVCIYRWPRDGSILSPRRSHCPWCDATLAWYDNIPVVSFIFLKARCRSCRSPISWRYPIIEISLALLWTALYIVAKAHGHSNLVFLSGLLFFSFVILVTTLTDLEWKIIPDQVSLPLSIAGLAVSPFNNLLGGPLAIDRLKESAIGCFVGGGVILLISVLGRQLLKKEVMGGGDVKLLGGIGAFLGYQGALLSLFLGSLIGGIFSLVGLATGRLKRSQYIPFGPFLNIGALTFLVTKLLGTDLWSLLTSLR